MKVAVFGSSGHMGQYVTKAVNDADDMELVAAVDAGDDRAEVEAADVVVDFTHPDAVMGNIEWCVAHDIHMVVGTTGFNDERLDEVRRLLDGTEVHILIAPNFSIAAVLMMSFAKKAAPFFDSVEVIELHHPRKADAPSGTAASTASAIAEARHAAGCAPMPDATTQSLEGARGATVNDVHVHSVRLAGLFAHQEVVFGNPGELMTIRDDSFDRSSYMPGVLTAVRRIGGLKGLTVGINELLGIDE